MRKELVVAFAIAATIAIGARVAEAFCLWGPDCTDCDWGWISWC